jgi:hypothetical protein
MSMALEDETLTEAVGVFHDVEAFQRAIDALMASGITEANLSVLASETTVAAKLGHPYKSTTELEDDLAAPRATYVPNESVGDAQGALIGAGIYVPACLGMVSVIASGGTMLAAIAAAVVAGSAGGFLGAGAARWIGREHTRRLDRHLAHGGLLLWVRTHSREKEQKAVAILRKHGGDDVHLHQLPEHVGPEADMPRDRIRVIHLLFPERR